MSLETRRQTNPNRPPGRGLRHACLGGAAFPLQLPVLGANPPSPSSPRYIGHATSYGNDGHTSCLPPFPRPLVLQTAPLPRAGPLPVIAHGRAGAETSSLEPTPALPHAHRSSHHATALLCTRRAARIRPVAAAALLRLLSETGRHNMEAVTGGRLGEESSDPLCCIPAYHVSLVALPACVAGTDFQAHWPSYYVQQLTRVCPVAYFAFPLPGPRAPAERHRCPYPSAEGAGLLSREGGGGRFPRQTAVALRSCLAYRKRYEVAWLASKRYIAPLNVPPPRPISRGRSPLLPLGREMPENASPVLPPVRLGPGGLPNGWLEHRRSLRQFCLGPSRGVHVTGTSFPGM